MLPDAYAGNEVARAIREWDADAITGGEAPRGEATLIVRSGVIADLCRFLKSRYSFVRLSSVTAVDRHPAAPRFEVIYHLHSIDRGERLRLKCLLTADSPEIDSVTGVWRAADWYEREIFDLFGVIFRGHPNLKRLLMPADWEGYPLRKDFPVHGHKYDYQDG